MLCPSLANQLQRTSWWIWSYLNLNIIRASPIWQTPPGESASGPADTAVRPCTAHLPKPTSWPSPRLSTTTGAARVLMAPYTWGKTRTPSPARRSAPLHDGRLLCALACLPRIAVD
jgi:hypothetical protein